MSYEAWFCEHSAKHARVVKRLIASGYNKEQIINYFEYDNMKLYENDFCQLYAKNKKCHDILGLNCYLCGCPNFRFCDDTTSFLDGVPIYSYCFINSEDGMQQEFVGAIHQSCDNCQVPHRQEYIKKVFDLSWEKIMQDCQVKPKQIPM